MGRHGLEAGGQLAGVGVDQQLEQANLACVHGDDAGAHEQGRPRPRLAQKADVMIPDHEGRLGLSPEGAREAERGADAGQALHGARHIEAHVHVPHLVAFPGVDRATSDLKAGERLSRAHGGGPLQGAGANSLAQWRLSRPFHAPR